MHRARLILLLVLGVVGCSPWVKDGASAPPPAFRVLHAGTSIGQTFVAREAGLSGVEIFLAPQQPGNGELGLRLRADPQSARDVATSALPAASVTTPAFYRFAFPPESNSQGRDYYLLLEYRGEGEIRLGRGKGDAYLDGALYENDEPQDAQLAFRLVYDPLTAAVGFVSLIGRWLAVILVTVFLFVLPGWGLMSLVPLDLEDFGWAAKLGIAASLSLAIYPLLFLWTGLVDLRLGWGYALAPGLSAAIVLLWRNRAGNWRAYRARWRSPKGIYADLALVVVIVVVVFTRFWAIRSLDVPLWGDSYQHTVIAQLIVDHNGLFESWKPYADLVTFTYHFGFHAATAAVAWLGGFAMPEAVLWTGQIVNILAVLALYPLGAWVGQSRWAGVGAVLVGGLLAPMPMAFVNWGRYTQLAGQAILPGAVYVIWQTLDSPTRNWRQILLAAIALGGLALTHYLILVLAVIFVGIAGFFHLKRGRATWTTAIAIGLGAGILFLPWFAHTFSGRILANKLAEFIAPTQATTAISIQENDFGDLLAYLPLTVWLLLLLGAAWGLLRRERATNLIVLWCVVIVLVTNPQWLRLPGQGIIGNFTILIAAYIPASILIGAALGWLVERLPHRLAPLWIGLLIATLSVWGGRERLKDVNIGSHALATRPDLRAAAWIQARVPRDARFLVNTFFAYAGTTAVGSDGGWWLPILARRETMLPPINYAMEPGPSPRYSYWINALPEEIQAKGIAHPDVLARLRERGIAFVYIGQQQGRVNYNGPHILQPEELLASSAFRAIYHQDRVWVFEIQ